jgi:hypothetical protein
MSSEYRVSTPASLQAAKSMLSQCDRLKRVRKSNDAWKLAALGIFKGNMARTSPKCDSTSAGVIRPANSHFRRQFSSFPATCQGKIVSIGD